MLKFIILWLIISLTMGFLAKIKINGQYLTGTKRFIMAFILGFPLAVLLVILFSLIIPLVIALFVVAVIWGIFEKVF